MVAFAVEPWLSAAAKVLMYGRRNTAARLLMRSLRWSARVVVRIARLGPGDPGIVTHGGETFGYSSTVAYDPTTHVGVVLLSNGSVNDGGLA